MVYAVRAEGGIKYYSISTCISNGEKRLGFHKYFIINSTSTPLPGSLAGVCGYLSAIDTLRRNAIRTAER